MKWEQSTKSCMLWLGFVLFHFRLVHFGAHGCSSSHSEALLSLKGGDNSSTTFASWKGGTDCCTDWAGVTCDDNTKDVIAVNVTFQDESPFRMAMVLSSDLCQLNKLQVLDIRYPSDVLLYRVFNHYDTYANFVVKGDVPACLWEIETLRYVALDWTDLYLAGSTLPPQACRLSDLRHLSLARQQTIIFDEMTVPACLWDIRTLQHLALDGVLLSGSLPPQVCNLTDLRHLSLADNDMVGNVPPCLWSMKKLEYLDISGLQVVSNSMSIPALEAPAPLKTLRLSRTRSLWGALSTAWLGNFSQLVELSIHSNGLTEFPDWTMNLTKLAYLDAASNNFVSVPGLLESSLDRTWVALRHLDLSLNPMEEVPPWFGNVTQLETLLLDFNGFTRLPSSLFSLQSLNMLSLNGNRISSIPPFISQLRSLSKLYLAGNSVKEISGSFSNLSRLRELTLENSTVDASSVSNICSLSNIEMLNLSFNNLTGTTGSLFATCNFSQMLALDLSYNSISGNISDMFPGGHPVPQGLDLSSNDLTGELPESFYYHTSVRKRYMIRSLFLAENQLTGRVLEFQWGTDSGAYLDLSRNRFEGPLPSLDPVTFTFLDLSKNSFTGPMPAGLAKSVKLKYLDISENSLSGFIPDIFGGFQNLETLDVSSNNFTGSFPSSLGNCFTLSGLYVSGNRLSGPIPDFLGNFANLQALDVSGNRFTGILPASLGNCSILTQLYAFANRLSGPIPSSVGGLRLAILDLSFNRFNGTLPANLGNCSELFLFNASNNNFRGEVPATIGAIGPYLHMLLLSGNSFQGSIPSALGNCTELEVLDLSNNRFTGTLPTSLRQLSGLRVLMVGFNHLHGAFPPWISNFSSLQMLNFSNNGFQGELPRGYSRLNAFVSASDTYNVFIDSVQVYAKGQALNYVDVLRAGRIIDLSNNKFNGSIPDRLGELCALRFLILSGNHFEGSIPESLSKLKNLESLDLSRNFLSGCIPPDLALLTSLASFNVSTNNLTGPIPQGGQFSTFSASEFDNNPGLCGHPLPRKCKFSEADTPLPHRHRSSWRERVMQWVSLQGFFVGFATSFLLLSTFFTFNERAKRRFIMHHHKNRNRKPVYMYRKPYGAYVPKK